MLIAIPKFMPGLVNFISKSLNQYHFELLHWLEQLKPKPNSAIQGSVTGWSMVSGD